MCYLGLDKAESCMEANNPRSKTVNEFSVVITEAHQEYHMTGQHKAGIANNSNDD